MSLFANKTQSVFVDKDILTLVQEGKLFSKEFEVKQLGPCAYDLRAGSSLTSRQRSQTVDLTKAEYVLEPGELATVQTLEHVDLSDPVSMGLIFSNHTQLSQGMFHPLTSIDPGFSGPLTITVLNTGNTGFRIRYGERIAKLVLMPVSPNPDRLYGKGQKPRAPEGSLEHSLVVDKAKSDDDFAESDEFFSGPLRKLAERVTTLESGAQLFRAQQRNRLYGILAMAIWTVFAGAVGGAAGNNWKQIVDWLHSFFHH
jgi:deoxycytidine triphosphate deaminase